MRSVPAVPQCLRARVRVEDGFTLVELMVALTLMSVAMLSLLGVFFGGLQAAMASSGRTAATALATRETETMRAVPYDALGFYSSQGVPVNPPAYPSGTTVILGATPPAAGAAVEPDGTDTVRGTDFAIDRTIIWADAEGASATTYSQAYKKTIVEISWDDAGTARQITQESIVYPGGRGAHVAPTTTTSTTISPFAPDAPTMTSAAPAASPFGETQIDAAWTLSSSAAVTHYIVQWSIDPTFNTGVASSSQQPATATTMNVTGLAPATTYYFRAIAYEGSALPSAASNSVSATTLTSTSTACAITNLTVSGTGTAANQGLSTKTYLNTNGKLAEDLSVVLTYSGTCIGTFTVQSVNNSDGSADPGSPFSVSTDGTTRTGTIPSNNDKWSTGVHRFTVLLNGSPPASTVEKTMQFCAGRTDVSSDPGEC